VSGTQGKLRRMADQIAMNFAALGHDNAMLATADHINLYWDPRMKAQIFADDHAALSPIARAAIEHLQAGGNPPPQTRASEFNHALEVGHSDAG
jgi:formate dehydrogenase subunit delta